MRPIKLTLQAFGAYPDKIEIPFENLGINNIYLIHGMTGSGKTTIFDAISYALFSLPSGQYRKNQNLRSHFASDDKETYVQFDFLYKGEKYRVFRDIKINKGKIKTSAIITLPNSKTVIGNKEVDNFIVDLLGINASQFSQIALLAQGEFMKLLNSDTKTRSEIFRNIFKTSDYKVFQEKLKSAAAFYRKSYDEIKNSIIQYSSQVDSKNEKTKSYIENYSSSNSIVEFDEFLKLLKEENKEDNKNLADLKIVLDKLNKDIIEQEKTLQIAINKQNLFLEKEDLIKKLDVQKISFEKIKDEYQELDKKEKEEKELILKIEKSKQDYENSILIKELEEKNKNYLKNICEIEKKLKENEEKILNFKNDYLKFISNEYFNFVELLEKSQNEFLKLKDDYNEFNNIYVLAYNNYISSQAGVLAKTLKENSPCPVCGSKVHPNIAKLSDEVISKEELDLKKENLDKLSEILAEKSKNCSLLNEKKEQKLLEFKNESKRLKIKIELDKYNVLKLDYLLEIEKNEKLKDDNIKNIDLIKLEIEKNNAKIKTLSQNLNFSNINQILEIYETLKTQKEAISAEIKQIKELYQKENELFASLKSKLELIEKQIDEISKIDSLEIDELKTIIIKYNTEKEEKTSIFNSLNAKLLNNEKLFNNLVQAYKKYLETEKNYLEHDILSKCANGDISGRPKIEFEQYIQGYYLDMVLFEANKRLNVMTKNRYRLLRKKDFTSIQSKESLELEVMDFHTFKKRSTKTLSGGESFMAALSLALGLSDCISAYSNVSIDALFIDEGFGSLDSETLQTALDVIIELTSSNKLVGIISHVDDLKTRIQNRILTTKTDFGSQVQLSF